MGTQKPRILPWLISQLDMGQMEGVAWVDANHTRFRIPWKHHLRQDTQEEDFRIFQAWAEVSGAYNPQKDKPDPPTWKRNFRSALNRKEVLKVAEDHSKDPLDPHKIYEFVTPGVRDFAELDTSPDINDKGSTSDIQEDILEDLLENMALAPGGSSGLPVAAEYPPQVLLSVNTDVNAEVFAPCPNLENPLKQLLVPEDEWEFEVTVFYRGRQVFQQAVFCPGGLRLVGSEAVDTMLPGQPMMLPDPGVILTDKLVVDYVRRILRSLGGGLTLWRAGQRLWARRLGHCSTFWVLGEDLLPDGDSPHIEVPKDVGEVVFDLGPFVTDLIAFIGGSGHSPRYTLWFCIGQLWLQDEPWTKKLVMVKVVPTCLQVLLDMARVGGASSLETVDLHISNSNPLSLTSDQYKACLQDLVEDMDFQVAGEV
ncbi:PREDICTED: interferon regulatory factor 3 [Chrysochloris asiatica]|uniref:Interferon regulatory factor 3 n=1 Tax=Chrysochloris asiatica TaxID=185453 RepID=A0A9B0TVD5_CHRAS|nr:PREDICTED: interferon regulatory factor 3 [Chrysochloris asiatica]